MNRGDVLAYAFLVPVRASERQLTPSFFFVRSLFTVLHRELRTGVGKGAESRRCTSGIRQLLHHVFLLLATRCGGEKIVYVDLTRCEFIRCSCAIVPDVGDVSLVL